jgi:hypothetical protein
MCAGASTYLHTCTHTYMYTRTHTHTLTHAHACTRAHAHTSIDFMRSHITLDYMNECMNQMKYE